jgi:hypothetical protein
VVNDSEAYSVPLSPDNVGDGPYPLHTGTAQARVKYFWLSTVGAGPNTNDVTVTVGNVHGQSYTAKTTYDLYAPASSFVGTHPGLAQLRDDRIGFLRSPPENINALGITFGGAVTVDPRFASGQWAFFQIVQTTMHVTTNAGIGSHVINNGLLGADNAIPYANLFWSTDAQWHETGDRPQLETSHTDYKEMSMDEHFQTFAMFKPAGGDSRWIPLKVMNWDVTVAAHTDGVGGPWQQNPGAIDHETDFQPISTPPQWQLVHWNNDPFIND